MAESFEPYYHVPQQSRREKLVESTPLFPLHDPSLIPSDLLTCHNQTGPMFHITNHNVNVPLSCHKENQGCSKGVGVVNSSSSSSSSSSYLDPANIQVNNNNPILYQHQNLHQNLRDFDQSYNGGSSEIMVYKPGPLSLSLSSHNNNLQRYGSVIYGDKVGGCASNEVFSRNTVPLGPFTGYAMILKRSGFLKPTQQLLEDVCDVGARGVYTDKIVAADDAVASLMEPFASESLSGGGIIGVDDPIGGDGNEGRKNKPRLLTMLDEVYRRYRQYYQQMHTVVTSFEYVPGLSNAAPYASLAINAMSKHFRCLKNAIADQLQFMNKTQFQTCNRKDESPRFRNNDRCPYSQRPGFLEHHQHVWRPQRGLPDRAVCVLRAWLFEHFLHPYPTDTDKIMLAKQTGLSRSQVSNWFINARVRLWKPMVEEIHMLESQQAQRKSQREQHSWNKLSHDHLPSHNSLHTENPYTSTRNEFPNMTMKSQEQLHRTNTNNQQVGVVSNGVSLTLGLHQNHGVGLPEPFPMSAAQRFGLAIDNEGCVMSDLGSQNGHFGRNVIGGQLLHDFVG